MSPKIASLLQDPRTARELMSAILKSRTSPSQQSIVVQQGDKITRYKSVTAIQRAKNA